MSNLHQVSADLKAKVDAKIAECIQQIESKYSIKMKPVRTVYDINSSRTAGTAVHSTRTIRLNPVFLNTYNDVFVERTVVHELAHIAAHDVYRCSQGHNQNWKNMMVRLGVPPSRCHDYKVPAGIQVGKPKAKYQYQCSICKEDIFAGPKVHAKIQRGATYHHNKCGRGSTLKYVHSMGRVTYDQAEAALKKPIVKVPTPQPKQDHAGMNKFDRCLAIYMSNRGATRATIISKFVNEVNMTPAGAVNYYQKCKIQ